MPMFDFVCTSCQHSFEALVRGSQVPACPACGSEALEKQIAMAAAKRRDKAQGQERVHAQRQYELNHDD